MLDADATTSKVTELGGQVTYPAIDTPVGRLAGMSDDQGGAFFVVQDS